MATDGQSVAGTAAPQRQGRGLLCPLALLPLTLHSRDVRTRFFHEVDFPDPAWLRRGLRGHLAPRSEGTCGSSPAPTPACSPRPRPSFSPGPLSSLRLVFMSPLLPPNPAIEGAAGSPWVKDGPQVGYVQPTLRFQNRKMSLLKLNWHPLLKKQQIQKTCPPLSLLASSPSS